MKRLVPIILCLLFLFCACSKFDMEITPTEGKGELGDYSEGEIEYVVNEGSKKYHLPSCYHVKDYENPVKTKSLEMLREKGYSPCANCLRNK